MRSPRAVTCLAAVLLAAVGGPALGDYKDYSEVVSTLNNLATGGGSYAVAFDVGTTANGTKIRGIVISKDATVANNASKPDIILIGTLHAREWIACEVCLHIANYLVANKTDTTRIEAKYKDMNIKKLLENAEIVIVPVANPDGYKYSRNEQNPGGSPTDPDPAWLPHKYNEWRKNRKDMSTVAQNLPDTQKGEAGDVGADLNRNFTYKWMPLQTASNDPTDYTLYHGPSAGSEAEVQAVIGLVNGRNVVAFIDLHAYSKVVMYPWAYTTTAIADANEFLRPNTKTKDKDLFAKIADKMADEIGGYTAVQASHPPLYKCSGASCDWGYHTHHCAFLGIEIGEAFQPPPAQINGIAAANLKGARWLMFWAVDPALKKKPAVKRDKP